MINLIDYTQNNHTFKKDEVFKMKVNIAGKGMISLLGVTAPVRNKDLTEKEIRALILVKTLKVYDAETGVYISPANVDGFFAPAEEEIPVEPDPKIVKTAAPVVEPVAVEEVVAETVEEAVTEETKEEVVDDATVEAEAPAAPKNNNKKKNNKK